ncbi:hypothetical protein CL614_04695 [archaeon]|jgi:hypothetical protein|nr:hypothetical protein [archaeon]|tara:strand:- start:1763 stop:1945 length:183 start_codon:yes stop_codon:yes gene_type:complete
MHAIILNEQVIRGLKAKVLYESCTCTPIDKCECDAVMEDIKIANEWIESLDGEAQDCCDG